MRRYSSFDMVRMAKFAKDNPELKAIPLINAYNKKYPEVTMEQKLKNIRNWLDDSSVMAIAEPNVDNKDCCKKCGVTKEHGYCMNVDCSENELPY